MVTQGHRRIAVALLAIGGLAVVVITFWPTPIDAGFADRLRGWLAAQQSAGGTDLLRYGVVEFAANIAMFVPLGFVLAVLLPPGRRWLSPIACFGLSLLVETGQALFRSGRLGDLSDLLGNTIGGLIGAGLLAVVLASRRLRTARRERAAPTTPYSAASIDP